MAKKGRKAAAPTGAAATPPEVNPVEQDAVLQEQDGAMDAPAADEQEADVAPQDEVVAEAQDPVSDEVEAGNQEQGNAGVQEQDSAAKQEAAPRFPARFKVTSHTRMPVRLGIVDLGLGPAPSSQVIVVKSEDQYRAMKNDLEAIRVLNRLPADGFVTIEALDK